jgi:hypothetical protein
MNESQKSFQDRDKRIRKTRKRWELALILPAIGALFFLTPLVDVFTGEESSLQRKFLYVFGVWAVLIAAAYILSRALRDEMGGP